LLERGLWTELANAPDLVSTAADELTRFFPPAVALPRVATEPVHYAGVDLEPGQMALLSVRSACHDAALFERPAGSSAPQDMTTWARARNKETDRRTDTLVHMQPKGAAAASWEAAVDDGRYSVTVGVGDPSYLDSVHRVLVEGAVAVAGFTPTSTTRHAKATVTVDVVDGLLTLASTGGTNTKLEYVTVDLVGPAPTPVTLPAQVDFVPTGASPAAGSTADVGAAFDTTTGRGWVAAGSSTPQDMTTWGRKRNVTGAGRGDPAIAPLGVEGLAAVHQVARSRRAAGWSEVDAQGQRRQVRGAVMGCGRRGEQAHPEQAREQRGHRLLDGPVSQFPPRAGRACHLTGAVQAQRPRAAAGGDPSALSDQRGNPSAFG
jgi:hypothetical protein